MNIPIVKPDPKGIDLRLWHRLKPEQPSDDERTQAAIAHRQNAEANMPRVLLFEFRHGETEANKDNLFRGWRNYPLDEKGRQEAEKLAHYFHDKELLAIISSDLVRAAETSQLIAQKLNVSVHLDPALRPWNVGNLAGQPRSDKNVAVVKKHLANPDLVIPGGESYNQFKQRFLQAAMRYGKLATDAKRPLALGVHTSNVMATADAIEGREPVAEVEELIGPGGVAAVILNGGHLSIHAVWKESENKKKAIS